MMLSRRRGIAARREGAPPPPPAGALSFVDVSDWDNTASTTHTVTAPATVEEDDLLVAYIQARTARLDPQLAQAPAGWELAGVHRMPNTLTTTGPLGHLFIKKAVAADASGDFDFTSDDLIQFSQMMVLRSTTGEYRVDDRADRWQYRWGGTGAGEVTLGQIKCSVDGSLGVLFGGCVLADANVHGFTLPGGWTRRSTATAAQMRGVLATCELDKDDETPDGTVTHSPTSGGHYESHGVLIINPVPPDDLTVEVFTEDGTWDWAAAGSPATVEVLVVAGGGAGGSRGAGNTFAGGGGGGGGVLYDPEFAISGDVAVVVGGGGDGDDAATTTDRDGTASSFGALATTGGGGGGAQGEVDGRDGGSGGGGRYQGNDGGSGTVGQGNDGGDAAASGSPNCSGGGGGATVAGGDGTSSFGGRGGRGLAVDGLVHLGELGAFGGGGGGGNGGFAIGRGGYGDGGGGPGTSTVAVGQSGLPASGGGGGGSGGGSSTPARAGGHGGSGVVIVRYPTP